jgi:hypothetical protein
MERYTRNYEDSEKVGKIVILRERSDRRISILRCPQDDNNDVGKGLIASI